MTVSHPPPGRPDDVGLGSEKTIEESIRELSELDRVSFRRALSRGLATLPVGGPPSRVFGKIIHTAGAPRRPRRSRQRVGRSRIL